jgi:hypothetical protein
MKHHLFALALALLPSPSARAPQAAPTAAEVVARARAALGWDAFAASGSALRVSGPARFLGTDARHVLLFDGAGRRLETFEGPLSQVSGSDGHTQWTRDFTDTPRVLALGDLAEAEIDAAFRTGAWTAAGAGLEFELVAPRASAELALSFAVTNGFAHGTIHLDAASALPLEITFGSDDSPATLRFSDYRREVDLAFPREIELVQAGIAQSFVAERVERLATAPADVFTPRLARPTDVRFAPGEAAALEVKRVPTGHLLVHPRVDGEDLGWFIFDSGAGINCIARDVAEALPEGPFGEIGARGVGGTVPAHFWRARELALGPARITGPLFMELDLAFLEPHFGVPVGGVLGFELLARCVAELDMRAAAIALHDPSSYVLPEGGRWEEVLLYARNPCVRAELEGRAGIFKIDTGAADNTLTLHYQVVRDLDLTAGRETRPALAGGVGGTVRTSVGTLASFVLGGHEFRALEAGFTLEDKGAFGDDYVWGNIGGRLLEPFRLLVFDYPSGRLGFVPRE